MYNPLANSGISWFVALETTVRIYSGTKVHIRFQNVGYPEVLNFSEYEDIGILQATDKINIVDISTFC